MPATKRKEEKEARGDGWGMQVLKDKNRKLGSKGGPSRQRGKKPLSFCPLSPEKKDRGGQTVSKALRAKGGKGDTRGKKITTSRLV